MMPARVYEHIREASKGRTDEEAFDRLVKNPAFVEWITQRFDELVIEQTCKRRLQRMREAGL